MGDAQDSTHVYYICYMVHTLYTGQIQIEMAMVVGRPWSRVTNESGAPVSYL